MTQGFDLDEIEPTTITVPDIEAMLTEIRELRAENARLAAENAYLRGKCEGHEIARGAVGEPQ